MNFYDDDDDLITEVSEFVASGLRDGDAVVVVATNAHRADLDANLASRGLDAAQARTRGQYICLDAAQTLSEFMVGDEPEPERFAKVVGGVIEQAAAGGGRVRAFGEMVALLWNAGNVLGAVELESLWNELARTHEFSLYCAYPLTSVSRCGDLTAANRVCELHSDVVAPLSYRSGTTIAPCVAGAAEASELFVPVPSAARAVRRFVRAQLERWDKHNMLDDACLVASELATNAVRHADSAFEMQLRCDEPVIRIAVRDVNAAPPERRDTDAAVIGGRGLAIVERIASRWGAERRPDGKVVWAELIGTQ